MTGRPFNAIYADDPDGPGPYRAEVDTGEGFWYANGLTFATETDADAYARDLFGRWTLVRQWRTVPTATPLRERVAAD